MYIWGFSSCPNSAKLQDVPIGILTHAENYSIIHIVENWSHKIRRYNIDSKGNKVKVLRIFLMALAFISPQIHAKDDSNLSVKAKGNEPAMVSIPGKNYEIGKYEVTQGEWRAVMGNNPSYFSNCGDTCPVEKVSWNDAQEFIKKLNAKTGKQYRLPTETEWEYACYGGSKTEYCGGNNLDAVAWYNKNSNNKTHPAGQKQANGYGLYDMSGNVWEWTNDCHSGNCEERVVRGGSWSLYPKVARAASRSRIVSTGRNFNFGFRLARTLP